MAATTEGAVSQNSHSPRGIVTGCHGESNERKERHARNRWTAEMEELRAK